jgi:hypothetical protein
MVSFRGGAAAFRRAKPKWEFGHEFRAITNQGNSAMNPPRNGLRPGFGGRLWPRGGAMICPRSSRCRRCQVGAGFHDTPYPTELAQRRTPGGLAWGFGHEFRAIANQGNLAMNPPRT